MHVYSGEHKSKLSNCLFNWFTHSSLWVPKPKKKKENHQ